MNANHLDPSRQRFQLDARRIEILCVSAKDRAPLVGVTDEFCSTNVRPSKVPEAEVCTLQIRILQICSAEVCHHEMCPS